ncbi:hypothetical protein [Allonocardiopsis opalescens]|uniref:Homeodomain-like domain-containing protein n=1 Tax=Allonocardiopsis opalescens TaxID=1144618 RepID=A0A2T0PSU9_9ACTN|nr:hypothetical protein [Allonocardiopsis opalescens]PRX91974.1 hypothetical protein CLV72_11247 [Allonocardiopsis opalescens]
MPAPLPAQKRAAILADIQAGELSRNAIARKHKVSVGTVTNIANKAGLTTAFDRSGVEKATRARVADAAAVRAEVSRKFLDRANEMLDQMHEPHLVFNFGGKDNDYNERILSRPPTTDLRNLMTSAAVAIDKHLKIESSGKDPNADAAASMLGTLRTALEGAADRLRDDTATEDGS